MDSRELFQFVCNCFTIIAGVIGPGTTFWACVAWITYPQVAPFWLIVMASALAWGISWERIGRWKDGELGGRRWR